MTKSAPRSQTMSTAIRMTVAQLTVLVVWLVAVAHGDDGLVAQWKLQADARDSSGGEHHAVNHGVQFDSEGGAVFDGRDAWLEVPVSGALSLGKESFSIAAWVHTDQRLDDVLGDLMTCYDPPTRTGFTLSLMNYAGVTNAQSNWRNLLFGIDAGRVDPAWTDCGRPGTNQQVKSLTVFSGDLYAAVWESAAEKAGHVYRYAGGTRRVDCGSPDKANAIACMAVFDGKLFSGVLPSGHVLSLEAGKSVTYDRALPAGWHHVVAVKSSDRLRLYVDGRRVAESSEFNPLDYDLSINGPLKIGFGQHDYFNGMMKDVRIYNRELSPHDVELVRSGTRLPVFLFDGIGNKIMSDDDDWADFLDDVAPEEVDDTGQACHAMPRSNPMAAKKCKCGRKLILEMDKVRGRCFECVKVDALERTRPRKRGGKRDK
ncbi:MAG: LamG domain-containing protein [Fuerstiella sp.]